MTQQGDMQAFFRAIGGSASDYNTDFLTAAATESFTGEFNGVFIQWLQDRTGSSSTNLDGLKQEFADLAGAHNWQSVGGVPIILEGCQLWFDAADTSATNIVQSGGSVSQWADKSSNGNNTDVQSTGSKQPTTGSTTKNFLNVITADGGDTLKMPSALHNITMGANTIFTVSRIASETAAIQRLFNGSEGAGSRYYIQYSATAGTLNFVSSTSNSPVAKTGNTNTNWNIIRGRRSGTTQAIAVNGSAETTDANGADESGIDEMFLFSFRDADLFFTGDCAEIILYDRSLSTAEISAVENYLSNKWAITLV